MFIGGALLIRLKGIYLALSYLWGTKPTLAAA
jgi:hypothetical protein